MALTTLSNVHLAYGHAALLDGVNFALQAEERVGLIGRNGTGKSSLLKLLARVEKPDDGEIQIQSGLLVTYVAQESLFDESKTIFDVVSEVFIHVREMIAKYELGTGDLDELQNKIEAVDGWNWQQKIQKILCRLQLDPNVVIGQLSGGNKRRVALACGLVTEPQVLLLDEPTNHLDLFAISWLTDLLKDFKGSVMFVTHDRYFLDSVATRIVELDRGVIRSYPGNFTAYQKQKAEQLVQEATISAKADRLLAQEEIWIRKGVEARRTRAVARIERLEKLRAEYAVRRSTLGRVKMDVAVGDMSGKLVSELTHISKHFADKCIVRDFSCTILRGDKVGLLGPNGAGKTTLLKLILGQLVPDPPPPNAPAPAPGEQPFGTVRLGSNVTIAYFDQMRSHLDLNARLEDFISPGSEWIEIGNERKHVKSYLGDFLFSPARANSPISSLSGGERNRLLLARLFARPANVLVLDEPTNDLDIDTLDLLEELLQNYAGTVFLVSHDRAFVNNVVSSTIVFEDDGIWREYEGGVDDWLRQSQRESWLTVKNEAGQKIKEKQVDKAVTDLNIKTRKLSYKEQRELNSLPELIEKLEKEQAHIQAQLSDGAIFVTDNKRAVSLTVRCNEIDEEVLAALMQLEELKNNK